MSGRDFTPGGTFVCEAPEHVPAVWGTGGDVLWAEGEALVIAAPQGVGKTTLLGQLAWARAGIGPLDLLGLPVTPDANRYVAYIAADRPRQIARSMRRMLPNKGYRQALDSSLLIWEGPLPFGIVDDPSRLAVWLTDHGVGTVIVDSLKDVAIGLADAAVGAAVGQMYQHVTAAGIEIAVAHHQRKAQEGNKKPRTLDDVYGSTWITSGAGSVVLLWGSAGDPVVELNHLKQPAEVVGPLRVFHERETGRSARAEPGPAENRDARERFRVAVIAALRDHSPLARDAVLAAVRQQGAKGKSEKLRGWLSDLSTDPTSGIAGSPDGYLLRGDPANGGHPRVTPAAEPWPRPPSSVGGGQVAPGHPHGGATPPLDPGATPELPQAADDGLPAPGRDAEAESERPAANGRVDPGVADRFAEALAADQDAEAVMSVVDAFDAVELRPPGPPPCWYAAHRDTDWRLAAGGPVTCGECHPAGDGLVTIRVPEETS